MTDSQPDMDGFQDKALLDTSEFRERLALGGNPVHAFKEALQHANQVLEERYRTNVDIVSLVTGRAWMIDQLLSCAWERYSWGDPNNISLLAVGGFGRGELHPHSDIDLLLLTRKDDPAKYKESISGFFTLLWDINLEIGQSVRSIQQCRQEALKDITVATSLMESRTIVGPESLRDEMIAQTQNSDVWPAKSFFLAKRDEQIARHEKYYDIDYALEPNVKTSPGGLRDIQTIAWIAKRHYRATNLADLVTLGFLTASEYQQLANGEQLLWRIRFGLHLLAGRKEDRLLFDRQKDLARMFGYEDDEKSLAVEKLMQEYYRAVATLRGLNDMLLQHFDEAILRADEKEEITIVNNRFQIRNDYIEARNPGVFRRFPFALMEIFVLMAQNPQIVGVRAATIRLIREHQHLIDDNFRKDLRNVTLFMELLRSPHQVTSQLRRMSRYGVLGRYLPEFGAITGKMQHDLFHIYTVDAHTLQVVENMRRFRYPGAEEQFPIAAHIARRLPKVELLYIAGLYHDIAKGRGGDHSTLGMVDATEFCQRHHLSAWDTKLVTWLVGKHLLMSMTAQRMDIADPEVIHHFALDVGDKLHLDYLYAMTVADINATNPTLWNTWRASLLRQLYLSTKRALRRGLENPIDRADRIKDKQESVILRLLDRGMNQEQIESIWANIDDEYFVRESTANIAWHTEAIAKHEGQQDSLVLIEDTTEDIAEGATQIFIYTLNRKHLFASSAAAMEQLGLNIQDARIFTSSKNYCMNTYTVLESDGNPISANVRRRQDVINLLKAFLAEPEKHLKVSNKRIDRKLKHFSKHVETEIINSEDKPHTTLEINCPDQPGILASIGKIFADHEIQLQNARIATLGERVEDLFFIVDANNQKITDPEDIAELENAIKQELGSRVGAATA
ncbi:MAG: [protein-PII] uridylyltransferase [Gammaproteobacteria bacterium]|nr:[protein-PII] uridylyltransferase [Gammaproteobacteria bacterium]MDP2140947.1 [protein-PII] uridylyltransferase [Gammaproteobacteria bacterium]MDP2349309.1 [protein-PII] uridylyltransferase [Gammaproteobacteria bacterium]